MKGRSAFTNRCGFAGLGQPEVEQGDLVVILFGADVPFILRPKDSHYTFIGDCYVHGIMQGELIDLIYRDGEKLNGPELREFKIRWNLWEMICFYQGAHPDQLAVRDTSPTSLFNDGVDRTSKVCQISPSLLGGSSCYFEGSKQGV